MAECSSIATTQSLVTQISLSKTERMGSKSKCDSENTANTSMTASNPCTMHDYNMTPDMVTQSFNVTLKFISPAASSGPFCRICHEGDNLEDLVSLCRCTGSVGLVHLTCMERWLSTRRNGPERDHCEICNYPFETIRYPKSLTEWYRSDQGPITNRHSILGDVACFALITPLAGVSAFLCLEGAKRHVLWNNGLEAGCLMALATFLITVYLVWNILTIRYHIKSYFRWRTLNQNVKLVRVRRKSTSNLEQVGHQRDPGNINENGENGNSRAELVTNEPITPVSQTSFSASDLSVQASNLHLTST